MNCAEEGLNRGRGAPTLFAYAAVGEQPLSLEDRERRREAALGLPGTALGGGQHCPRQLDLAGPAAPVVAVADDLAAARHVLGEQDRSLWDEEELARGRQALARAVRLGPPGRYALQAAIDSLHVEAPDPERTDWIQVAALYGALAELDPSPVVALNRAAAVGFVAGPEAGLELLEPLLAEPKLEGYVPLHATHAEMLRRQREQGAAAAPTSGPLS